MKIVRRYINRVLVLYYIPLLGIHHTMSKIKYYVHQLNDFTSYQLQQKTFYSLAVTFYSNIDFKNPGKQNPTVTFSNYESFFSSSPSSPGPLL